MPTTYAHYKFGKDVIGALPKQLQRTIKNNRECRFNNSLFLVSKLNFKTRFGVMQTMDK